MKIRLWVLPLMLVAALFVMSGCTEKGDPAWGEKQKTLLEELLNKPTIKHGAITVDHVKKEWTVPSLEVVVAEDTDERTVCTIDLVRGVNVALEPLTEENGLLAEKMELKGLSCVTQDKKATEGGAPAATFTIKDISIEKLNGSQALQEALLSVGQSGSLGTLAESGMEAFTINGVTAGLDGSNVFSLESFSLRNMAEGFAGPIQLKKIAFTPAEEKVESISIADVSAKKIGSKKLFEELVKLQAGNTPSSFTDIFMSVDFLVDDLKYSDIRYVANSAVPAIVIKSASGSTRYDGVEGSSASTMNELSIEPETLQYLVGAPLANYPFKPVKLSFTSDVDIKNTDGAYTVDYKTIRFSDPSYGSFDLQMNLTSDEELFRLDNPSISEASINSFSLKLEDKALSDLVFDITSLISGGGVEGGGAFRALAVGALQLQCGQLPANLQGACKDTASFLEKKGVLTYTLDTTNGPVVIDDSVMQKADSIGVKTTFTPAK